MPVTFDPGAEPGLIRLEGEIDISQADELKRVLLAALQEKHEVRIALESASGMDITAVQLLWAAERGPGRRARLWCCRARCRRRCARRYAKRDWIASR